MPTWADDHKGWIKFSFVKEVDGNKGIGVDQKYMYDPLNAIFLFSQGSLAALRPDACEIPAHSFRLELNIFSYPFNI